MPYIIKIKTIKSKDFKKEYRFLFSKLLVKAKQKDLEIAQELKYEASFWVQKFLLIINIFAQLFYIISIIYMISFVNVNQFNLLNQIIFSTIVINYILAFNFFIFYSIYFHWNSGWTPNQTMNLPIESLIKK